MPKLGEITDLFKVSSTSVLIRYFPEFDSSIFFILFFVDLTVLMTLP
ncbi:MAG: hypothetical protein WCJ72_13665 [Chryseobacterium sp.]